MNFKGQTCPYCNETFKEDDDIVVCPDCGTPHHRKCYKEHGACAFAGKHSEGYVFEHAKTEAEDNPSETTENDYSKVICNHCGTENDPSLSYCRECGWPLKKQNGASNSSPYAAAQSYVASINMDDKIDGVPLKDYKVYLGKNSLSYILAFIKQAKTGGKIGFNFAAVISPVLFFLFYRMWGYAAIMMSLSLLLSFPTYVVTFLSTLTEFMGLGMAVWAKIETAASLLLFFITIICGLYSTYLLRISSNKKIVKIRNSCTNEEDYAKLLSKKSCPSKVFIVILVFFIIFLFAGYLLY